MKKNWFYLFMLMAITVMPLTSCDKEDEQPKPQVIQQHDPNSDSDQSEITAYDAMEWLQNSLVIVDENGEVIRRVYGKPLDESQPDVISVSVADYAAAGTHSSGRSRYTQHPTFGCIATAAYK